MAPAEEMMPMEPVKPILEAEASTLVSNRAAGAATSALAALSSVVNVERMVASAQTMTPLGNGARTLEDMTLELMRPAIKEWLDQNLPALVERLVQKEIDRISKRGEG